MMADLPARSSAIRRSALALAAALAMLGVASGARAGDDAGVRGFFSPGGGATAGSRAAEPAAAAPASEPAASAPVSPAARPLTVRPHRRPVAVAAAPSRTPTPIPRVRPEQRVAKLEPSRGKPPAVSIFQDRTLRRGDAVMTAKGIRIFEGNKSAPFGPDDFVAVSSAKIADGHSRRTLMEMDRAPRF